jgi:CheY-like chemotaxis protein
VLVIDDDPDYRSLIETVAACCQLRVVEASDCNHGLKALEVERHRIKMVLLDYFMPGMEPVKCAAAIVAKAGRSIPVVLVTAAVDPAARATELKLTRWISKPFDISTLTSLLTDS